MITKSPWLFLITLIIFVLVVWSHYWKFQLMFNSSSVSLYTPDSFQISNRENYQKITERGFDYARTQRIVIAGMVRDVESKLPMIMKRAEKLGEMFGDYRIVIVENDSADGTRRCLLKWAKQNPKVTILGCGRNVKECFLGLKATKGHSVSRSRIEKMAHLRNIYLQEIKDIYPDFDYVAVWDMDIIGSIYLDGVANTMGYFEKNANLGAMCAYGIYQWGPLKLYYDTFATIEKGDNFHINSKTFHDVKKGIGMQYKRGQSPIEMISCFSGFTIYRGDLLTNPKVYYDMTPKGNLECEHVRLHKKIISNGSQMMLNPSMIHLVVYNP